MRKIIVIAIFCLVAAAGVSSWYIFHHPAKPSALNPVIKPPKSESQSSRAFDSEQYSLTDPTSIWVIANKQHPLTPVSYAPNDLQTPNVTLAAPGAENMQVRAVTASGIEKLFAAADKAGLKLEVISGYRSYAYQVSVYNGYVKSVGQVAADSESARPGYSEHQTGLAVDIGAANGTCNLQICFADTPEGKWLAANAYLYGFILRYPADKTAITGYMYEPWHFRYVGTELTQQMHQKNIETLEEFFSVSGGTTY